MKIALDDPVWNRLHSAYGVQDVAGPLRKLHDNWDSALANDLFWNKLHHQDTLYPATYAALPWLWPLVGKHAGARSALLGFFAHEIARTLAFAKEIAPSCPTVAAFLTGVIDAGLDRRDLVPTVQDDRQTSLFD